MCFQKKYKGKWIDLSKPICDGMKTYIGDPAVSIETIKNYGGKGYTLSRVSFGTHTGTHVDAPAHMKTDGKTLDEIPIEKFLGPVVVVDNTTDLPLGKGLIFKNKISIRDYVKIFAAKPPFVAGEMTEALEKKLLDSDIITYTDLINVELIPTGKEHMFYGLPMRLQGCEASPVRAVVFIQEGEEDGKKSMAI